MIRPKKVKPLDGYKIWIEFEDGVQGEADLSRLAGKGVFKAWDDRELFNTVRIDFPYRAIVWGDSDALELVYRHVLYGIDGQDLSTSLIAC